MDFLNTYTPGYQSVWEEELTIHAKDIDYKGLLKFYCICGYFFEMAARHANHLRFGFKDLELSNVYWVLSRFHIKMNKYPGFEQKVHIQTWHKGIEKLFGLRDFRIIEKDGQETSLATSAWLILDKKTGRPIRPDKFTELHDTKTDHHAIREIPEKLEPVTKSDKTRIIEPGYTDLDINSHVNAGKYIAWIQDLYPLEFYDTFRISEFQINYLNETRVGEKVRILAMEESHENNPVSHVEGRIDENGNPAFRARIKWSRIMDY